MLDIPEGTIRSNPLRIVIFARRCLPSRRGRYARIHFASSSSRDDAWHPGGDDTLESTSHRPLGETMLDIPEGTIRSNPLRIVLFERRCLTSRRGRYARIHFASSSSRDDAWHPGGDDTLESTSHRPLRETMLDITERTIRSNPLRIVLLERRCLTSRRGRYARIHSASSAWRDDA